MRKFGVGAWPRPHMRLFDQSHLLRTGDLLKSRGLGGAPVALIATCDSSLAEPVSPHGLRAGFVTTAYRNGVPDEEIMGHTRHRSLTTMRSYVRRAKLSQGSPAGKLGL